MKLPLRKAWRILREDGASVFLRKTADFVSRRLAARHKKFAYVDVLFVNGCDLQHPYRYRVQHQREQLAAFGLAAEEVWYENLSPQLISLCRAVIVYRAPWTPALESFIRRAQQFGKPVFFDIDDLVIDTRYTDQIPFVAAMSAEEKALYDDGVSRYRRTMQLCDGVITTTERLADELRGYMDEVFVNRNTASAILAALSREALEKSAARQAQGGRGEGSAVTLGYFSGSITHNDDYAMILPVLTRLLDRYPAARLLVVGELDLPPALAPYRARVDVRPFVGWTELPALIAEADINLVPLLPTIFNEAKSENKWVEAALVRVPTVASDLGAFHRMIRQEETGLLCHTPEDWERALARLIEQPALRARIGARAQAYVLQYCLTLTTGRHLADYIRARLRPNIAMLLPSFDTSGGILVALHHCEILRRAGYDVTAVNLDERRGAERTLAIEGFDLPSFLARDVTICTPFAKGIATMWVTVGGFLFANTRERYYLVQGQEDGFYPVGAPERLFAQATYCRSDISYVTISRWCERWLRETYGQCAAYAPNGIERASFAPAARDWTGRVRILIEGDSASACKNVDESFRIAALLPEDRYEIWYVSYNGRAKSWYRVDRFLHKVPYKEMPDIYRSCHILLKSSVLESFSYPPLEMMATGGIAVVRGNDGNREYLRDGENCLFYDPAHLETAADAIARVASDAALRERLQAGGRRTAAARDWSACEAAIAALYEGENDEKKGI